MGKRPLSTLGCPAILETSMICPRTPLLSPHAKTASSPSPRRERLEGPALAHALFVHAPKATGRRKRSGNRVGRNSPWRQAFEHAGISLQGKPAVHSWCGMPADDYTLGIVRRLAELPHLQGALELSQQSLDHV